MSKSVIEVYIETQDKEIQPILTDIYRTVKKALPDAEERISYQMPTFREDRNLIHFAAQKKHLGIYPGAEGVEHFADVLDEKGYKYSKGAIQMPYDKVDLDLIREIAAYCEEVYSK